MAAASLSLDSSLSTLDFRGATIHSDALEGSEPRATRGEAPDIVLPHQTLECVRHIALDIGGSLIKLVYFSSADGDSDTQASESDSDSASRRPSAEDAQAEASSSSPARSTTAEAATAPFSAQPVAVPVKVPAGAVAPELAKDAPPRARAQSLGKAAGRGGRLHFVKFETSRVEDAVEFIQSKGLHRARGHGSGAAPCTLQFRATGGGAYKFADLFKERLGVTLRKEDEISCVVGGCNFLLRALRHEAFECRDNECCFLPHFSDKTDSPLFPYLLVNIGSGVSIIKVDGVGTHERVSGTNLGGGTFWGLCRLLTGVRNFDEMLELSSQGDSASVDMLVGDIYGGRDYEELGLSAGMIASSFGKVVSEDKDLADLNKADVALALCRMVSYNIGHLAFLNAKRYGISRVFFGGFFIRGHLYTMNVISYAIRFWSKGEMTALFLRHEGFLGAMGAFLKGHPLEVPPAAAARRSEDAAPASLASRFVERYPMGSPFTGGTIEGPAFSTLSEKLSWVEKFVEVGAEATEAARQEHEASHSMLRTLTPQASALAPAPPHAAAPDGAPRPSLDSSIEQPGSSGRIASPRAPARALSLKIGVLHYEPTLECFPLLAQPAAYIADTYDLHDPEERDFWLSLLAANVASVVEKACLSEGPRARAEHRRARAMGAALTVHFERLRAQPELYGPLGLSEIFDLREACLREFKFHDIYQRDKARENSAAVQVLGDLLRELDGLPNGARLLALVQGALAGNIFDWGAQACVGLYHDGTILEIYQKARNDLSHRPWRVDHFDRLAAAWFACAGAEALQQQERPASPFRRVMLFVDNAGADAVLGMMPLARELLCMRSEVVLVANSEPAINDITAAELAALVDGPCAAMCPVIAAARAAAKRARGRSDDGRMPRVPAGGEREARLYVCASGSTGPCLDLRRISREVAAASADVDLVVIEGMGRAVHTNYAAVLTCPVLKLAMIKSKRVAERLFGGNLFDCMCRYDEAA